MTDLRPLASLLVQSVSDDCSKALPDGVAELPAQAVFEAGALHRVRPALRRRLAAASGVPSEWMPPLEAAKHQQLIRHLRALADLGRIRRAFERADVRWAVTKGPVLAAAVWPHPDMREYTDLDVLVHPADFGRALAALESEDFTYVDRNWPEVVVQNRAELAMRGPSGFPLDLHWDIAVSPEARRAFPTDLPAMLTRTRFVDVGGDVVVPALEATDTLLHVAHHAALSGANRLMWIADVFYAARQPGVDWDELERRARAARMLTTIAVVLARAERAFNTEFAMPTAMRARTERTVIGRTAVLRERRHPFPGLPGDAALSGLEYASGRENAWATVGTAARSWWRVRWTQARVARFGPDVNPLDADVADVEARRAYLTAVTNTLR